MQKGGLLLVQDDVSVVAQKHSNRLGVALPRCKVECCVLHTKTEHGKWGESGESPLAALLPCFIADFLKRMINKANYLIASISI